MYIITDILRLPFCFRGQIIEDRNLQQDSLTFDFGGQLGIVQFTESRACSNFFQGKKSVPPQLSTTPASPKTPGLFEVFWLQFIPSHQLTTVSWGSSGELLKHAICSTSDFESVYSNIKLFRNI